MLSNLTEKTINPKLGFEIVIQAVAGAGVRDEPKKLLVELNKTHGLPPGTIKDAEDLYPTVPSSHIATCTKDKTYFGKLPVDKQAYFIALGFVMIKSKQQQAQKSFSTVVNEPDVHYGDANFRTLNSFRTM